MQFDNSSNLIDINTSPMSQSTHKSDAANEHYEFLRQLFDKFDHEKLGYVSVDAFMGFIKESLASNLDENKLQSLLDCVDPFGTGQINFTQFSNGIKEMTAALSSNNENAFNTTDLDRKSNISNFSSSNDTFIEIDASSSSGYDFLGMNQTPSPPSSKNSTMHKSNTSNTNSSTNPFMDLANEDEGFGSDLLGLNKSASNDDNTDLFDNLKLHTQHLLPSPYKKYNVKKSDSKVFQNDLMSMQGEDTDNKNQYLLGDEETLISTTANVTSNHYYDQYAMTSSSNGMRHNPLVDDSNHGNLLMNDDEIMRYEEKIRQLENEIDYLKNDKLTYLDKYSKMQLENTKMSEKIQEQEELYHEMERTYQAQLDAERLKLNEYAVKLNLNYSQEKDAFVAQLTKAENEFRALNEEKSRLMRQINDLNKSIDSNNSKLYELNEKMKNLQNDYQRVSRERDMYRDENSVMQLKHNERVEMLTREITELKSQQETSSRRSTINNDDRNRVLELESEIFQYQLEIKQLKGEIQELNDQLSKSQFEAGKQLLMFQNSSTSLAAEIETMSKDELMDKLKTEQSNNQSLRSYIERILPAIMEKSPEILEVKMPSMSHSTSKPTAKATSSTSGSSSAPTKHPKFCF